MKLFYYLVKYAFAKSHMSESNYYYHGVNKKFLFSSMLTSFNSPTSTSISLMVALQFTNNNGVIVQLNRNQMILLVKFDVLM